MFLISSDKLTTWCGEQEQLYPLPDVEGGLFCESALQFQTQIYYIRTLIYRIYRLSRIYFLSQKYLTHDMKIL
jgi:hypothetical protein